MRIIHDNVADWAWIETISGADDAKLPASNMGLPDREKVWRTSYNTTAATLAVYMGSRSAPEPTTITPISALVLHRSNLTGAATWRVRLWEDDSKAVLVYDSGTLSAVETLAFGDLEYGVDPYGKTLYSDWGYVVSKLWFSTVYGGYAEIELSDSTNPDKYLEVGRMFLGTYFEPAYQPDEGMQSGWVDMSKQERTDGGNLFSEPKAQFRRFAFQWSMVDENDRIKFNTIKRTKGMRDDMFISVWPEEGSYRERANEAQAKLVEMTPTTYGATFVSEAVTLEEI